MNPLTRKLRHGELVALDVVAGLILAAGHLLITVPGTPIWPRVPAAIAIAVPVTVRRLYPLTAVMILLAGLAVQHDLMQRGGVISVLLVMYAVGLLTPGRRAVFGLVAGSLASAGAALPGLAIEDVVPAAIAATAAWFIGRAARARREYLSRETARRTERAVAEERLRIARDLHDIVAHSMSLITVQSGVAALAVHQRPDAAADALRTIEKTSRASVAEMRRMLGVLRSDEDAGSAAEHAPTTPAPGLRDLPQLAEQARQAGVQVTMNVTGTGKLTNGMALSVYRIVQEALTNVVKHAAPAHCWVDVAVKQGTVTIEVIDDGPGQRTLPGETGGHGLVGMRERVAMCGGRFAAGPRPDGGFRVSTSWEVT